MLKPCATEWASRYIYVFEEEGGNEDGSHERVKTKFHKIEKITIA
jgi:hypothetical protein